MQSAHLPIEWEFRFNLTIIWLTIHDLTRWVFSADQSLGRERARAQQLASPNRPGGNPGANLKSISHRCYLFEVAFVWELTKETVVLPLGCLQGG